MAPECGAAGTIRTCDSLLRRKVLYPLSYGGETASLATRTGHRRVSLEDGGEHAAVAIAHGPRAYRFAWSKCQHDQVAIAPLANQPHG